MPKKNLSYEQINFSVPVESVEIILSEISRITKLEGIKAEDPAVRRGLALECMAINSAQAPND